MPTDGTSAANIGPGTSVRSPIFVQLSGQAAQLASIFLCEVLECEAQWRTEKNYAWPIAGLHQIRILP
jgi:hypothetical protein